MINFLKECIYVIFLISGVFGNKTSIGHVYEVYLKNIESTHFWLLKKKIQLLCSSCWFSNMFIMQFYFVILKPLDMLKCSYWWKSSYVIYPYDCRYWKEVMNLMNRSWTTTKSYRIIWNVNLYSPVPLVLFMLLHWAYGQPPNR